MALIQTKALVLKAIPFQETSSIVRLFTRAQGRTALIAKGARRLKSPFRGYLETLTLLDISYYYKPTREIQTLAKADIISRFAIDYDANRAELFYATALIELIDRILPGGQKDEALFDFCVQILETLDQHPEHPAETFLYFLIGLATLLGYQPEFKSTGQPGDQLFYHSSAGHFSYAAPQISDDAQRPIDPELGALLQTIAGITTPSQLMVSPDPNLCRRAHAVMLDFLGVHLEQRLQLRSLQLMPMLTT